MLHDPRALAHAELSQPQAHERGDTGEDDRLDDELSNDAAPAGTERRPDRELAHARGGARVREDRDVHGHHDQHHAGQQLDDGEFPRVDVLDVDQRVGVGQHLGRRCPCVAGKGARGAAAQRGELGLRRFHGHPRGQPPEDEDARSFATLVGGGIDPERRPNTRGSWERRRPRA